LAERGVDPGKAWLASLLAFLATPLFPYSTLLQGHAPAAVWLLAAFASWIPATGPPSLRRAACGGAAASCALATEYLTAIPLLAFGGFSLARRSEPDREPTRARRALAMVAGAIPGLVLLGIYHEAAFGSPWALGYQRVALPFFQEKMSTGVLGVNLPDVRVAFRLLFEPYRGLFPASPLLLLAVVGMILLARDARWRAATTCSFFAFIYYWMLNAGHATWHGGWAVGPRHMVPAIPLLAPGIVIALRNWPRAVILAGGISLFVMLAATAVGPEVPEDIQNPYSEHFFPHFLAGDLSIGEQGFADLYPERMNPREPDRWDAFLLGEALGLPRHLALLPLFLVWAALWPWRSRAWYKRPEES
jgi:hypothetical protein